MDLTTEEVMALKVLQKDMTAARALAEKLVEDWSNGVRIDPVKRLTCDVDNIRVVAYIEESVDDEALIDPVAFNTSVTDWLREGGVLMLRHVSRLELFQVNTEQL